MPWLTDILAASRRSIGPPLEERQSAERFIGQSAFDRVFSLGGFACRSLLAHRTVVGVSPWLCLQKNLLQDRAH